MVVELMGRHAGWIALFAGVAGTADVILIPEIPYSLDPVCQKIEERWEIGREFAIVVADAWHGKGIATELLRRLIDVARDRRLDRMTGVVLRENKGMLALAEELGFEERADADDPQVVIITLDL